WEELGLTAGETAVRDLFAQEDLGVFPEGWGAAVPPLAAVMVRVEGTEPVPAGTPWVSELPWKHAAGFGAPPARDRGWAPEGEGPALLVDGETQAHGIGVPGGARLVVHLGGACRRFVARAGLTDHAGPGGSVTFEVHADGTRLWESGVRVAGAAPVDLDVDVTGRRDLQLVTTPAGDTTADDLAAWAGARLYCD
ncbi:MAG: NPCBM/NEW2 domain-containing protein, partial [Deltaproteobacteria bacterium]|nr:NPCBM/NEW2 domain-containing protein [Deltaproteobacteria bacterium]